MRALLRGLLSAVVGNVVSRNRCGSCTLCCTLVAVGEIEKRGFTRCPHQSDPPALVVGCAIYADRPHSCRKWSCLFFENEDWPDELRPDRCGVVFDPIIDLIALAGKEMPAQQAWVRPGIEIRDLARQPILAAVHAIARKTGAILFRLGPEWSCGVVYRKGKLMWAAPSKPGNQEPERERMDRAAMLARRKGLVDDG